MKQSNRELHFLRLWRMAPRPEPVAEHRFHPVRRWRFDFAWPDQRVAVEIQGGTFSRGKSGHTSGVGVQRDCEKRNAATLLGWRVLFYTTKDLESRPVQVVEEVQAAIEQTGEAREAT